VGRNFINAFFKNIARKMIIDIKTLYVPRSRGADD